MAQSSPSKSEPNDDFANDESFRGMDDQNKESTTLIWFDPNIGSRKDTIATQNKLRHINDYVIFHVDLEKCVEFIQSIDKENIFLITSGAKASQILPRVASLRQIDSIFIFCLKNTRHEHLANEYAKIIGIYIELEELCQSIKEQVDLVDKQLRTFSFFDQQQKTMKDLSKESSEFLWFQLFNHVIARLPKTQQAKQEMIQMCRQYYRGNTKELTLITQFEQQYRSEEAILWYSRQSFVYKLINKALRTEDIDLLYLFRFYIGDLSHGLELEHSKMLSSGEKLLTVYRGAKLEEVEFAKLKENRGKLISTNGYLSTSRLRSKAVSFAMKPTKRTDVISVLFEIECRIKTIGRSVIFADITELSEYTREQEVLFDLNSSFRVQSIENDGALQIIKMHVSNEGQQITKDYIDITQKETEKKSVSIVFGKLMCDLGEYDKSLKYFEQLLMDPNDEDVAWIHHNIGRALYLKGEWEDARNHYNQAYDLMMDETPQRITDSAYVFHNIGLTLEKQGEDDEALEYYERALQMKKKYYPADHIDIASTLNNIGTVVLRKGDYNEAISHYEEALNIKRKYYRSGHPSVATTLNNIGNVHERQGKYTEALDYYRQALKIRKEYYPHGHVDIAQSFYNIGLIHFDQGQYALALDFFQQALEIRKKYYPSGHLDIGESLDRMGACYEKLNAIITAVDCYRQAMAIYQKFDSVDHSVLKRIEQNIRRLTESI